MPSRLPEWLRDVEADIVGTGRIVAAEPLAGGEVNETLLVRDGSGRRFVVRRAPEQVADWHPTIDGQVAAIDLARRAGVPVPEVVAASGRVLAYRYVEGRRLDGATVRPDEARATGRMHGLLHAVTGDGVGPVQADGRSARWPPDVAFADVAAWVEDLGRGGHPIPVDDLEAAADLVSRHAGPAPSCLLHGDAGPANTIVAGRRVAALIDFDDAWFGDPAGDLAWWWWHSPNTADQFAAGGAETAEAVDRPAVHVHRLRLLLGLATAFARSQPDRARHIATRLRVALLEAARLLG